MKKAALIAVAAVSVFFIITQPTVAGDVVTGILGWLRGAAEGIIAFVKNVFA